MIGYPLDSHVTYKADGTPVWDRAVSSAPYRKLINNLFSDGVLPNPSTNLQVSEGEGMQIKLSAGFAICNGCQKLQEADVILQVPIASVVYDRIDTVVLRLNDNDDVRECEFYVVSGAPAETPSRPVLTRTDSIWELGIADILVRANATQISNANITDTRYDAERCGIISSISQFDTTTLYQQIQADLTEFKTITQADILNWYNSMKGQLSEDAGGNLQLQIGVLSNLQTNAKDSLVEALNSLTKEIKYLNEEIPKVAVEGRYIALHRTEEKWADRNQGAFVQDAVSNEWYYIYPAYDDDVFYHSWILSYYLNFDDSYESKSVFVSCNLKGTIIYYGATGVEGEKIHNASAGTYSFEGIVIKLKRRPTGNFICIVENIEYLEGWGTSSKLLYKTEQDLPRGDKTSIGSATAAANAIIYSEGIYTLKVYTISSNALAAIYQYVYFSDYNNAGAFVGKLSANTGTLSNTYGTIAVSTADQGVKITTVKGYRIDVSVKAFD